MDACSGSKGFGLNKLPCIRAGSNHAKANANILAQIIEKNCLRSIIYIMLVRVNKWSSGKGFGLNYHVFELVQILPRQFANILAQIIEKYWLRSVIYIKLTRMNKWSSGKGFGLNYHAFELVQMSLKAL